MAVKKRGNSLRLGQNSPWRGRVRGKAKSIKKKTDKRKGTKSTEVVYHSTKEIKVEKALIENFIGLQKVMVNLSAKFDALSSQISGLLQLFEISARALARKEISSQENLDAKKVMEKIDRLSAQAGLIGKGLALIHEVGTETGKQVIPLNIQKNQQPQSIRPITHQVTRANTMASEPEKKMTRELWPEKQMIPKTKPSAPRENAA